ncbi:hypothetical protein [Streptomyces chromofuscus]|uniref:Secreted protein n=1 Tax=Streptomyces chromofuscus TaxID=42881 RepID=A0A7M2TFF7_STRCW|nr:hypothetical protein [Streptomyces chromofuscus]QOV46683.1 hypothetical protein IPT68_12780 [Streptomyces chromofuscus]GGT08793.1 hypothetical protein GCM10010254_31710 [Streptomyces chromofuscus]
MIKKLACAAVMASALLASAPAAHAAPHPQPSTAVPGGALLNGLLGSLEIGHPVTSLRTILPSGVSGR